MPKRAIIIFCAIVVAIVPFMGFPGTVRTGLLVLSGGTIAVIAYFSSVVYCSNCKKIMKDADAMFEGNYTVGDHGQNNKTG